MTYIHHSFLISGQSHEIPGNIRRICLNPGVKGAGSCMSLNGLGVGSIARMAMPTTALGRWPGKAIENEFNDIQLPDPLTGVV